MSNKLTIIEARRLAQENGFDNMEFWLHGPYYKMRCKWVDAYLGYFKSFDQDVRGPLEAKDFVTNEIYVTLD